MDRIELEKVEFFEKVRAAYLAHVKQAPHRYCVLDATKPLPEVRGNLIEALEMVLVKAKVK